MGTSTAISYGNQQSTRIPPSRLTHSRSHGSFPTFLSLTPGHLNHQKDSSGKEGVKMFKMMITRTTST